MGERLFHFWKDKFGMVLMVVCDRIWQFRWADIRHPGITSDYLTFATSELGLNLEKEDNNTLMDQNTMIEDNAQVETSWTDIHSWPLHQ